jgi:C-terminal peptidase prc
MGPVNRRSAFGLALILLVAACAPAMPDSTTSTTSPPTTTTSSFTSNNGREVETFGCTNPPAEIVIVCQSFGLILDRYVDDIEPGVLAAAAMDAFAEIEPGESTEPLMCAVPSEDFVLVCEAAAELGLDSADTAELIVGGFVANALDPNSVYLNPETLIRVLQTEGGQVEGVGAQVTTEDETIPGDNKQCSTISDTCRLIIVDTIAGGPAQAAGVMANDIMVAVDGESIMGWTIDEIVSRVRGPAGTEVTLTLERDGTILSIPIVRERIEIPSLTSERVGDTGYVRLLTFSELADERFQAAIIELIAEGVERLVIDFRSNPGGRLDTAVAVASVFLPDGDVVTTEGPEGTFTYQVSGASIVPADMPVDVVVNRGSASASEVVVGVLQERERVTAFGENTFGKNTVQQRFNLANGGALRLTTARWLTPGGLDFGGVGLSPDFTMDLAADLEPAELIVAIRAAAS